MGKAVLFSAQFHLEQNLAKLSDVVVDRSDLLLNVCASTGLVAMDKIQVQTPKGRCEKLQSVDPARRGRSNVSLIYLLQRPRVSPNYVRGALVKLSTKKNRFPHTFSKAPCSGMPYITWPCPPSSGELYTNSLPLRRMVLLGST